MKKFFIFFLLFSWLSNFLVLPAQASDLIASDEPALEALSPAADQDNSAGAELLGVSQPGMLPDSSFYFLKEWNRGLSNLFTFSAEGKAEKRLDQAAERLAEVQAMLNNPEANGKTAQALQKYQKDLSAAQEKIATIKADSDSYNQLLEKTIDKYSAFAKILAPAEEVSLAANQAIVAQIYEAKQAVLDGFAGNLENLNASEDQLADILSGQPGSDFKDFRNLEVLNELADRLPETAAGAISQAQEKIQSQLVSKFFAGADGQSGDAFAAYVLALQGSEAGHIAILDELAKNTQLPDEVAAGFRGAKDAVAVEFSQKMINHPAASEMAADLASGDIDKLKVLEEMAEALPPSNEVKATLDAARQKGLASAAEKISQLQTVDEQIAFLIKDGVPDAKSFTLLEQIQAKLTPEQQAQMAEVRNQAFSVFSNIVDNAENSEKLLNRLAGDSPKDVELIAAIKNTLPAELAPKFDALAKKQLEKVEARLAEESDINKLLDMRSALDDSPAAQALIAKLSPEMIEKINQAQTEKISQIISQAASAEEVVKLANQYNDLLAQYPAVALNLEKISPELVTKLATEQAEKIKAQLTAINDPEQLKKTLADLQTAGLDKLAGTLPPAVQKQITEAVKAKAKEAEKTLFMAEMQAKLGDQFNAASAEKLFDEQIGKLLETTNGFPDEAALAQIKEQITSQVGGAVTEEKKQELIQSQVQAELDKNQSSDKPSASEMTSQIMNREEVKNMTAPPSQAEIDAIKAEMEAEAKAKAQAEAVQNAPANTPTGPTAEQLQQSQPPANIPTGPTAEEIERLKQEAMQGQIPANIPMMP